MTTEILPHRTHYRQIERGVEYEGIPYFPHWAYTEFQRDREHNEEPPFYASMAITSGGHKRNIELDIGSVIAMNTHYGTLLRQYLAENNLGPADVIIPSELGSMRQAQWGQLDFLMLWYHIIAGVHEQDAVIIEDRLRQNGSYTDAKWAQKELLGETSEDTWRAYENFTEDYVAALQGTRYPYHPVKGVLGVLDGEMSLGGRAEKLLANRLDVPFYTLEAQEGSVSGEFRQELKTLTNLGARALHLFPEEGPRLIFKLD